MLTKEEFDKLEDLGNRLITMKSILGLSRTEKETLDEAATFIINCAESSGYPITDENE